VKTTVAAYYQKAAAVWNQAFAGTKYGDCLTFRLDLQLVFLPPKAPHQNGRHRVEYFTFFDNFPSGWFPTGPDDRVPTDDNPFPFQRDATGQWYSPDYGTVAHEIGHVLGLGDDYFVTCTAEGCKQGTGYKPTGQPFEGGADFDRGGTFTTSGVGVPDPTAVARVIQQMKAAGVLPQCWKGTMRAQDTAQHGPDQRCEDSWTFDLTVIVGAAGALSGEVLGKRASPVKCTHQYPTTWVERGFLHLEGQGDKQALHLKFLYDRSDPVGSIDNGMFAMLMGMGSPKTVDIPIVGKNEARAITAFAWTAGSSVRNATGDTTLTCKTC
jgi:hypothetical protein